MGRRWFLYLTALIGCLIFYIAYREWLSWVLLVGMLFLPFMSLLLSVPAMLLSRVQRQMPPAVTVNTPTKLRVVIQSKLPTPHWQVAVQVYHTITGENMLLSTGSYCPVNHCGALNCKIRRAWVYDYLGLFRLPVKKPENFRVFIRPWPLKPKVEPDLSQLLVNSWRPKPGGGFAENHELRLYHPGDNLHQIHWKLTAKTGKLVLREPMVPDKNRMLLWMTLHGEPEIIDRKLGRLLWMSRYLLRHGLSHEILVYTGEGQKLWPVFGPQSLRHAMDALLCHSRYAQAETPVLTENVNWQYYIGGEEDAQEA